MESENLRRVTSVVRPPRRGYCHGCKKPGARPGTTRRTPLPRVDPGKEVGVFGIKYTKRTPSDGANIFRQIGIWIGGLFLFVVLAVGSIILAVTILTMLPWDIRIPSFASGIGEFYIDRSSAPDTATFIVTGLVSALIAYFGFSSNDASGR